jgi:hypothetical protein
MTETSTLVRTATGKWRQPGVPHRGWVCTGIEDLGEPAATCEMCEVQTITYVHTMWHPDYPHPLDCGCICAGHMEQDLVAAREREAAVKRRGARRSRWLHRHWRTSRHGNPFLNADGFNIVVFPHGTGFGARFVDNHTGLKSFSPRSYFSEEMAKLAAFDAIARYKVRA